MASQRKRRFGLIALLATALLVGLGPMIIGMTPARDIALASALPAEAGKLTAGGAALGWFGPIGLQQVELRDPADKLVFSAERVDLTDGLLQLALGGGAELDVRVTRPVLELQVAPNGSNLDPLLNALADKQEAEPTTEAPSAKTKRTLKLSLVDGKARVTDTVTGEQWAAESIEVSLFDPGEGIDAIELTAKGTLAGAAAGAQGAGFDFRLGAAEGGGRLARLKGASLPLSILGPILRRNDPTASLIGAVSLDGQAAWSPSGVASTDDPFRQLLSGKVVSSGKISLQNAGYRGAFTGGEPLRLDLAEAPWRIAAAGDRLRIEQLEAVLPFASGRADGSIGIAEIDAWRAGGSTAPTDLRVAAQVDLQRLAQVAPEVLRLREGVRVESGLVRFNATGSRGQAGPRLVGGLRTESLAGMSAGQRIAWREPLDVRFDVTQRAPGAGLAAWSIDSLTCQSAFFTASASGGADLIEGKANVDLDRLASELSQFVDLGDVRIAGKGQANFKLQQNNSRDRWRLASDGAIDQLFVGRTNQPLASEQRLTFNAQVEGASEGEANPTGAVALISGQDRLEVRLDQPAGAAEARPFQLRLVGDLANWRRRARLVSPAVPAPEALRLSGALDVTASGQLGERRGKLDNLSATIDGLVAESPGSFRLAEQRLELKTAGRWDRVSGLVESDSGEIVSSSISMRTRGVRIDSRSPGQSRGEGVFRADMAQIASWFPASPNAPTITAAGQMTGSATLRGVPEGLLVDLRAGGEGLQLIEQAPGAAPRLVWEEPSLKVTAQAIATPVSASGAKPATYSVDVRDLRIESSMLNGSGGGKIDDLVALQGVRIGGGVDYDLERLSPLLWPQLNNSVRLIGKDRVTFQLASDPNADPSSAAIARLQAKVEAPWQGADVFGLPIGPGRLVANLQQGVLRTDPLKVAVGQGSLTTQAAATIHPPPTALSLASGPLITQVGISREVSERMLKYIAPVLADATRINGLFSISLSEFAVPLNRKPNEPRTGRAAGVLTIHQVDVAPGPMVAEWVGMARQVRSVARDGVEGALQPSEASILSMRDQPIEFQLVEGRVYHRGLTFNIGDAVVYSEGSVGIDETLDLLLTVPILDEWIAERPALLGRLQGQSLRIPVRGTFSAPRVDREAFRQLSGQLLQNAAAGAIDTGINLLLERLRSR